MERSVYRPPNTTSHLKEMVNTIQPDAVAIFGGGIVKRERCGQDYYSTTAYKDLGMGGKARVHAASFFSKVAPDLPILTLSSIDPNEPAHAEIVQEELLRKGVNGQAIITAPEPHNTFTEVLETYRQAKEHDWNNIIVISSEYHGDRIKYMYDHVHELSSLSQLSPPENALRAEFIAAEDILWNISPHYRKVISEWRDSPAYKARVEQEQKGMEDLRNKKYVFRTKEATVVFERKSGWS